MKYKSALVASPVLVLLAVAILGVWPSRLGKSARIRYALRHLDATNRVHTSWTGKTVIARGDVRDEASFVRLSHELAEIAGTNYVVNDTQVVPHEEPFNPEETVGMLIIPVNSRYDDSPESLAQISAVLRLPQGETINVVTDQTLSSVIVGRYRFGPSDLPRSYALLAQRIAELNGLHDTDQVHPGPLKVPILPARAQVRSPEIVTPHAGLTFYSFVGVAPLLNPKIVETAVVAPQVEGPLRAISMISVPITKSSLSPTRKALADFPSAFTSFKMAIKFASYHPLAGATVHKTLTPTDAGPLRAALSRKPFRNVTVFVLDDGWPDATTYSQSLDELQRLSDAARDHYQLPHVNLKTAPFVPLPVPRPHSSYIRDALKEFTDADTARIVKVVYVPLSRAQNSSPVLQELLLLHFIEKVIARNSPSITEKDLNGAKSYVSLVLNEIQSTYDDQQIASDEALLEAVWSIADLIARQSRGSDVFFINESWTVDPKSKMEEAHSGVSAGIAVVAVGNTADKVVNSDTGGLDFARQCASTRSVLAVLDVLPEKGLICDSSIVKTELLDDTFVAAFDGEVFPGLNEVNEKNCLFNHQVDQCVCGTSFSAPRIAWLLALSEALRSTDVEYTDWNLLLEKKIQKLRVSASNPWSGLYLHPADLLKP